MNLSAPGVTPWFELQPIPTGSVRHFLESKSYGRQYAAGHSQCHHYDSYCDCEQRERVGQVSQYRRNDCHGGFLRRWMLQLDGSPRLAPVAGEAQRDPVPCGGVGGGNNAPPQLCVAHPVVYKSLCQECVVEIHECRSFSIPNLTSRLCISTRCGASEGAAYLGSAVPHIAAATQGPGT